MNTIKLGELINEAEIYKLRSYVRTNQAKANLHKKVVDWIASQPQMLTRLDRVGMIREHAAYVFIYYLNIEHP